MPFQFKQPTASAGKDATIKSGTPTTNYGTATTLRSGTATAERTVIEFNLSSGRFERRTDIINATLRLIPSGGGAGSQSHYVRRLTQTAWLEAETTWNAYSTGNNWSSAGGDFTSTDQATFTVDTTSDTFVDIDITALCADAITSRSGTLSLLIMSQNEASANVAEFYSSDHGTASNHPSLWISWADPSVTADASLTFNSSTGYTFTGAETEFVLGGVRMKIGTETSSDVITPDIDTSGYSSTIHQVVIAGTEAVGYSYLYLVSFTQAAFWETFDSSGWRRVDLADIGTKGMAPSEVMEIREWTTTDDLRFAIEITRSSGGGDGLLNSIFICHGATILDPTYDLTSLASLPTVPSSTLDLQVQHVHSAFVSDRGYRNYYSRATQIRRSLRANWKALTTTEKTTLEAFLLAHTETHFSFQPLGEAAALRWISTEPKVTHIAPGVTATGVWNVEANLNQMFQGENRFPR